MHLARNLLEQKPAQQVVPKPVPSMLCACLLPVTAATLLRLLLVSTPCSVWCSASKCSCYQRALSFFFFSSGTSPSCLCRACAAASRRKWMLWPQKAAWRRCQAHFARLKPRRASGRRGLSRGWGKRAGRGGTIKVHGRVGCSIS